MKQLKEIIQEKLVLNKNSKAKHIYNYYPKDIDELKELVDKFIEERGNDADLNDIDTSEITDMSYLFSYSEFNGDISQWDVSNVKKMKCMFYNSTFTGKNNDISNWDVSSVEDMRGMFYDSEFNGNISKWNVSNVKDMKGIFDKSPLENNPPKWYKK